MNNPVALHTVVKGHVQGVYYRAFTEKEAVSLDLTGYVRNMPTGDVEVWAEGERAKLEELVKRLRAGPPYSKVNEVITEWQDYSGKFHKFQILYF